MHIVDRGIVAVNLDAVGIARALVDIDFHVSMVGIAEDVGIGLVNDGSLGRVRSLGVWIVYVVIRGIVVLDLVSDIVTLFLGIRLFRVTDAHTGNLLRDFVDRVNLSVEGAWGSGRLEHIAIEVCRDFLTLVVVVELHAKHILQRLQQRRYRHIREVAFIGYHVADLCGGFGVVEGRIDFDFVNVLSQHILACNKLRLCQCKTVDLYARQFFQFELTATSSAIQPLIDALEE